MTTVASLRTAALSVAAIALGAVSAQAADNASGTVRLKGTVALSCTVSVTDSNADLNLMSGENSKTVGEVTENCNSGTGYTISLSSANNGQLRSTAGGTQPVSYTVAYDGASGSSNGLQVSRQSAQFSKKSTLAVNVSGNAQAIAGAYSDTVTITIAAK